MLHGVGIAQAAHQQRVTACTHALQPPRSMRPHRRAAGDVWHVALEGLPGSGVRYALRVSGDGGWEGGYRWDRTRLLLDPRAPLVAGRDVWGQRQDVEEFQLDVSARLEQAQGRGRGWGAWRRQGVSVAACLLEGWR